MSKITASCKFNGHDLTDIPVLNPGGWFGKAWLVEIGGSYTPLFLVVEADTISDAIDELSDDPTFGHQIHVPESDLGDYPEDDRHYDGSGRVIDLDHVMVHGREGCDLPYPGPVPRRGRARRDRPPPLRRLAVQLSGHGRHGRRPTPPGGALTTTPLTGGQP